VPKIQQEDMVLANAYDSRAGVEEARNSKPVVW